jgi:hypothetical protein
VLVAKGWSDDDGVPHPGATTWGAPVTGTTGSGPGRKPSTATSPSPASAGEPVEIAHGRLRSLGSGLCLDVRGGRPRDGADLRLARCADTGSQQWSYQDDGMLRSVLDPGLCLAADPGAHTVVVSGCLVHAGEVSYDLTVRGELLLRWDKDLALAADGAKATVARRDGSFHQRWELASGDGGAPVTPDVTHSAPAGPKRDGKNDAKNDGNSQDSAPPPDPAAPPQTPGTARDPYGTRVAQVGSHDGSAPVVPAGPQGQPESVATLAGRADDVLGSVPATVAGVVSGVGGLLG